jgi:hypothetical protein
MAAIYMWPLDESVVVTTTLYPIEANDGLSMNVAIWGGAMDPIPNSYGTQVTDILVASYIQLRWYYEDGPYDSYGEQDTDIWEASYTQLRWYYEDGPYDSAGEQTTDILEASIINYIVFGEALPEDLLLSTRPDTDSTMDLI